MELELVVAAAAVVEAPVAAAMEAEVVDEGNCEL